MADTAGMQIFENDGVTVAAEVGGHVLSRQIEMAAKVGAIASSWAHLEAQLGGYMAALLETSPERTFALLEQFRSATATAEAAKSLAKVTLEGGELRDFLDVVGRFKELAQHRNRIQHALWAWKSFDPNGLYRVPAVDFSVLMLQVLSADEPTDVAIAFIDELVDRFDAARLEATIDDIQALLLRLTGLAIQRHKHVLQHPI